MKIRSKYKLRRLFPVFMLNLAILYPTYVIVGIFIRDVSKGVSIEVWGYFMLFFVLGLQYMALSLLKGCRYIVIYDDYIVLHNPILPFLRQKIYWKDIDIMNLVGENFHNGRYEAIWLIRNKKLKCRISSFYYANYDEMKKAMKFQRGGRLKLNQIQQALFLLGKKI